MNNKYDRLYNDFKEHLLTIVSNEENWKSFLDTVGNTSKYKFSEQVLINNQKPTATACATMQVWNDRMNCWINRGAKGIFIIDTEKPNFYRYVFDVSDVHVNIGGRLPEPLTFENNDLQMFVLDLFSRKYNFEKSEDIIENITTISEMIISKYYRKNDYLIHNEMYNEREFHDTLQNSLIYIMSRKFGILDNTIEFNYLNHFKNEEVIVTLGTIISNTSEIISNDFRSWKKIFNNSKNRLENANNLQYNSLNSQKETQEITVADKTQRSEEYGEDNKGNDSGQGNNIRIERGRHVLSSDIRGERSSITTNEQIRQSESEVHRGNRSETIQGNDIISEEMVGLSSGNRRGSVSDGRTLNHRDEKERGSEQRTPEQGYNDIYTEADEHNALSGRNSDERDSLFINSDEERAEENTSVLSAFQNIEKNYELESGAITNQKDTTIVEVLTESNENQPNNNDLIGKKVVIDDHEFIVEKVDEKNGEVSMQDISMRNIYPINRVEKIGYIRQLLAEQTIEENEQLKQNTSRANQFDLHPDIPIDDRKTFDLNSNPVEQVGKKERFKRNIEAIKVLKKCEAENRFATTDEQLILSKYVGWGGIPEAFDPNNSAWTNEYSELNTLLSKEQYSAARESTLTAFYTPPEVINAIYQSLERMGLKEGNLLEPSCGIGNFIGMLPKSMEQNINIYGVELDTISAGIAQQLYQKSSIVADGFEKVDVPDNFFDGVIGNVPFGDFKVVDKKYDKHNFLIHDYFFAKSLDKLRPNGVMALVTSKGTMDKANPSFRKYIAQRADLLGAIRLPNNTFKGNAGTEVVSDILFLQKRDRIIDIEPDWVYLDNNENGIAMNSYFVKHPEMILGEIKTVSGRFGEEITCEPFENANLSDQLNKAIENIQGTITTRQDFDNDYDNSEVEIIPANPLIRNFSYGIVDNKVYLRENSTMQLVANSDKNIDRIKGMIAIRDCVRELFDYQLNEHFTDDDLKIKRDELNTLYDNFVRKNGFLNSQTNKNAFSKDSALPLLCALENLDEDQKVSGKSDIFYKRTIAPFKEITSVDTSLEALAVSLNEKARVDIPYMARLVGKNEEAVIEDLNGIIFKNPETENWENSDEYLSGNIRNKLSLAKVFAKKNSEYDINVQALEKVMPKDLEASEIEIRLGATWLDSKYIVDFMKEVFETNPVKFATGTMNVEYAKITGRWKIEGKNNDYGNPITGSTFGTERKNAYELLEQALNLTEPIIKDEVKDENGNIIQRINQKETTIAKQKQEAIKEAFADWIFKDQKRRTELCKEYNKRFNSDRPREYDGSQLVFHGMTPEVQLRPHQLNAVARQLYGDNTLLAHCVGAGKTFEMITACMESKYLGLSTKAMFVVPNHLIEQWSTDFLKLYPAANLLVASKKDFQPNNRKKFCSRIATGDYDAVIIGHSQFEKIPMSKQRQISFIENEIKELEDSIDNYKWSHYKTDNFTVKQMERAKKNLTVKLEKLINSTNKDNVVNFEELGIDRLFVDESHNFKNLFLYTKMNNVAGISSSESQKSTDLFMKCKYMDEITGGKGITFATGTPISNSMTEMYTNMRYLQYNKLKELELEHFDSWAATFGEVQSSIELAPEGTGYRTKTRFAKFYNLPELMSIFKECADIQTADMLNLPVPKANYENIVLKPTEYQKNIVKSFSDRAERVRNNAVDPKKDNMLKITNDGRKLALDQRLINPLLPDDENSKVNVCVEKAYQIWKDSMDKKSTQLIFCDLSTPKNDGTFNVYDDLKTKLINKGVPENEIKFIHEAATEAQKKELFSKVRKGTVRFLIGSTSKMGAGTNVQDKLIALHHLDVPWRPSDIEQQEGRILRQGNENETVQILRYVTEKTFDSYSWQIIENKQKFISQIMTSKSPLRSCEDADEATLTYAEVKALATGNPYIKEKMDLDIQVSKLKLLKAGFNNQIYALEDDIANKYPKEINALKERIEGCKKDIVIYSLYSSDKDFSMQINNTNYTDKKEAGKAILDECAKSRFRHDEFSIGEYCGFKLKPKYDYFNNNYYIYLRGNINHIVELGTDTLGNITRINHALGNIKNEMEESQSKLSITESNLEKAMKEVQKTFPQEQELSEKMARLVELNDLLDMDNNVENAEEIYENENINDEEKMTDTDSFLDKIHSYSDNYECSKENITKDNEIEI